MKQYILSSLLVTASLGTLVSCDRNTEVIQTENTESFPKMKDATGTFGLGNNYALDMDISIPKTDVVLVYRNVNSNTSDSPVWQLLPQTVFFKGGRELDYNFRFDNRRVQVTTSVNFDYSDMTRDDVERYLKNQTFRVVLVPALSRRNSKINYADYKSVVKYYRLEK